MGAYTLARRIGTELAAGTLDFKNVDRFIGDSPRSLLFRLKEDCHALFRDPGPRPKQALRAEELFDLAVGALFHEAMKFRESCYLYSVYGPRVRRSLESGSGGSLPQGFARLFEAGYRRMVESEAETGELFRETRDQLRVLLREWSHTGEIARSLVAEPAQTEEVFEAPLAELLEEFFGSTETAYRLAVRRLTESGHYAGAVELLDRSEVSVGSLKGIEPDLIRGLARYYAGDPCGALRLFTGWAREGARGRGSLQTRARSILQLIAFEVEEDHPSLAREAKRLEQLLTRRFA